MQGFDRSILFLFQKMNVCTTYTYVATDPAFAMDTVFSPMFFLEWG